MLRRIATLPSGRRGKWLVLGLWILVVVAVSPAAGMFEDAQKNEASSFLPGDVESTEVLEVLEEFGSADIAEAVMVYSREAGLTARDRAAIAADRASIVRDPPEATGAPSRPVFSDDGKAAILIAPVDVPEGESDILIDAVDDLRERVADAPEGLRTAVTGPAGFSADAIKVFEGINSTLLLATAGLVFVLLILIYRSPVFWILPLLAVAFAEITVRAIGYGIASAGVVVNGQTAGILLVLVFGAGTDYALLLVARYREELRRHRDRHEAMNLALRRAGPAILASGVTNVCALFVLILASVNGTAGLGPVGAMGVAVAMVAMLTVLPALLTIGGRRAFWPFIPRYAEGAVDVPEERGWWRRLGDRIGRRPRPVWIGTLCGLLVLALGTLAFDAGITQQEDFRNDVESVEGQELLAASFPAGSAAPTDVIVPDRARVPAVTRALEGVPEVSSVRPLESGPPGVRLAATLVPDPYSDEAIDLVPELRDVVKAAGGEETLVGGPSAITYDLNEAAKRDLMVLPPIVLLVILVIIGILLRAIVAPLLLVGTVIVSFLAALGASVLIFNYVFDFPGQDPSLPLFGFIFLVALGVDYNIFLMARVREETARHGTREGMIRGLAVTGAVITSAGIVLAGTFSVLAVLPLVSLTQVGFLVAFGVLLDTFIVRSILLPATVVELDRRVWWPSALSGRTGDRGGEPPPG
jgi:RND superfamily putative drug exporter